jgi:hypothetical protein
MHTKAFYVYISEIHGKNPEDVGKPMCPHGIICILKYFMYIQGEESGRWEDSTKGCESEPLRAGPETQIRGARGHRDFKIKNSEPPNCSPDSDTRGPCGTGNHYVTHGDSRSESPKGGANEGRRQRQAG